MKKLLLISLLFLSFNCFSQNLPTKQTLFEGCTVIIVETTDRAPDALKKIQKAFKDQGFRIKVSDKDIFTMTASKPIPGAGDITITASINQAGSRQIILNGSLGNEVSTGSKIAYAGASDSASKRAFDEMHGVAQSYKGAKVLYGVD